MKKYYIYILASRKDGALYIGVTNDLIRRVYEHKQKYKECHSKKYNSTMLVYFESTDSVESAILREKQLKRWKRDWKTRLINETNPSWEDLYKTLI